MYKTFRTGKSVEKTVVARGYRERGWVITTDVDGVSFWSDGDVVKLDSGDGCKVCECTKSH